MLHSAILEQASPIDALMDEEIAICDAVRMEVLVGGRDEAHLQMLRRLLARATNLPATVADYDDTAALYRRSRRQGKTVRKLIDCLIASIAIRAGVPVQDRDSGFDFWLATRSCTSMKLNLSEPWPRTPSHEVNGAIVYRMDPHTVGIYQQVGTSDNQRKRRLIKWSPQC